MPQTQPQVIGSARGFVYLGPCRTRDGKPGSLVRYTRTGVTLCLSPGQLAQEVGNILPDFLGWAEALGKFLTLLTQAQTWVRVAEVTVGSYLIILGLKQMGAQMGVKVPSIPGVPGL